MKIHLRNTRTTAERWAKSPHIFKAITDGNWTLCRQIAENNRITDDRHAAECEACIQERMQDFIAEKVMGWTFCWDRMGWMGATGTLMERSFSPFGNLTDAHRIAYECGLHPNRVIPNNLAGHRWASYQKAICKAICVEVAIMNGWDEKNERD